ncbi:hypothetical protein ACKWTF_016179 [Chironomus riparius]
MLIILIVFTVFVRISFGANILYIQSVAYYSHQLTHFKLIEVLALKGHNLTVFSTHYKNFNNSNIMQYVIGAVHPKSRILESKLDEMNGFEYYVKHELQYHHDAAESQFENIKLQELYLHPENYNFDLLIVECNFCMFIVLAEIYNCPLVSVFSAEPLNFFHEYIGNYVHDTIHPEIIIPAIHGEVSFVERLMSLINQHFFAKIFRARDIRLSQYQFYRKFPNFSFPPLMDIVGNRAKMYFTDTSAMTTNIRPIVPNYHQIAFIHVEPSKSIEDLRIKKFLDDAEEGVIVLSFGSIANDFPEILFNKFCKTFQDLPFKVIWKADYDKFKHLVIQSNILISKWLQLSDILAHPNVKVLVGHGGLKTIEEAIDREVPMVLMPINLDQPFNTFFQVRHEIAVELDLNTFTKESLTNAIMEVMKPSYKENIQKVKLLAYDKMSTSLDEAVENIEYLLKHKEKFTYQRYEGKCSIDRLDLFYDFFWMIGRFLLLIVHAVNYLL